MRLALPLLAVTCVFAADPPAALMKQAHAAREEERLEEAIGLYRRVVAAQPRSEEAWWYLGMCLYEKQRFGEAGKAFGSLSHLQPKQGVTWAMLGLTGFQTGQYKESLEFLRQAHALGVPKLNGLDRVARYHLVSLLNWNGEFEVASGLAMTFVAEQAVTPQVVEAAGIGALRLKALPGQVPAGVVEAVRLAGEASVLAWQKRIPDAKAVAGRLREAFPDTANVHYLMGYLRLLENDPGALEEFEKELKLSPDHVPARLQIAYEYLNRGEAEKGLPYAERAVALAPKDFIGRDIHGRLLLAAGRVEEAVSALEEAVQLQPASAEAHFHLASAYARAGRKADAARHRAEFEKLQKPRNP